MTAQEQSALHDILEECYDVQLELSDLGESYELLICDIEIVIEEIRENLDGCRHTCKRLRIPFSALTVSYRDQETMTVHRNSPGTESLSGDSDIYLRNSSVHDGQYTDQTSDNSCSLIRDNQASQ